MFPFSDTIWNEVSLSMSDALGPYESLTMQGSTRKIQERFWSRCSAFCTNLYFPTFFVLRLIEDTRKSIFLIVHTSHTSGSSLKSTEQTRLATCNHSHSITLRALVCK